MIDVAKFSFGLRGWQQPLSRLTLQQLRAQTNAPSASGGREARTARSIDRSPSRCPRWEEREAVFYQSAATAAKCGRRSRLSSPANCRYGGARRATAEDSEAVGQLEA